MNYGSAVFAMTCFLSGLLAVHDVIGDDLQIGDMAPEFCCLDDHGKIWNSRDHVGKAIVVVYFYPGDFSRCCTKQAEGYRDRYAEISNECAEVVGVSGDVVEAHQLFRDIYNLEQTLLADIDGNVAKKFGVPVRRGCGGKAMVKDATGCQILDRKGNAISFPRSSTAMRWTFIIGMDGTVVDRDIEVAPKTDGQDVLNFLRDPMNALLIQGRP